MSILTLFGKLVNNLSQSQITQLIEDKKTLSAQVDHLKELRAAEFKVLRAATDQIVKLMEFSEIDTRVLNKCCDEAEAETVVLRNELTLTVMALNNANMRMTELEKDLESLIESRRIAHQTNATLTAYVKTLQDENVAMKTQHAANAVRFMKEPMATNTNLYDQYNRVIGRIDSVKEAASDGRVCMYISVDYTKIPKDWGRDMEVFITPIHAHAFVKGPLGFELEPSLDKMHADAISDFDAREAKRLADQHKTDFVKPNATLIARTTKNGNQHAEFLMDNDFGHPVMACDRFAITRVEA